MPSSSPPQPTRWPLVWLDELFNLLIEDHSSAYNSPFPTFKNKAKISQPDNIFFPEMGAYLYDPWFAKQKKSQPYNIFFPEMGTYLYDLWFAEKKTKQKMSIIMNVLFYQSNNFKSFFICWVVLLSCTEFLSLNLLVQALEQEIVLHSISST